MARDRTDRLDTKKRTEAACERDDAQRAAWWASILTIPAGTLVFLDETGTNTAMTTRYARAPRGQRATTHAPRNHGPNVTLVAALCLTGMGPVMVSAGAMTESVFVAYVAHFLVPWLEPGQVVVLDNLAAHTGDQARTRIEAAGCTLRFLPPYSPDFSPIEGSMSKLKADLRRAKARTRDALDAAIAHAVAAISPTDASGWFYGCGYVPLRQPL